MEILLFALFFVVTIIFFVAGKDDFGRKEIKINTVPEEEIKKEIKDEPKDEVKKEIKDEPKDEVKKEIKDEPKDEIKKQVE